MALLCDDARDLSAERAVFLRQANGILYIPLHFERDLLHGRQSPVAVYGDAIGPSLERLRAQGKSWDDIIDSATRPAPLPSFGSAG